MRAALGIADEEESVESETGALLLAEVGHDTHTILQWLNGYAESANNAGKG